ncbi:hypothetical protein JB92DRAFT_1378790 [Gautieria morchelliformis]|nr:hypothetical protein JB92DRAFT_1378790 [Gautieria morchelliformis]
MSLNADQDQAPALDAGCGGRMAVELWMALSTISQLIAQVCSFLGDRAVMDYLAVVIALGHDARDMWFVEWRCKAVRPQVIVLVCSVLWGSCCMYGLSGGGDRGGPRHMWFTIEWRCKAVQNQQCPSRTKHLPRRLRCRAVIQRRAPDEMHKSEFSRGIPSGGPSTYFHHARYWKNRLMITHLSQGVPGGASITRPSPSPQHYHFITIQRISRLHRSRPRGREARREPETPAPHCCNSFTRACLVRRGPGPGGGSVPEDAPPKLRTTRTGGRFWWGQGQGGRDIQVPSDGTARGGKRVLR